MGFDLCPGRNILHFFTFLSSDPEVQEEDQEVQEDVLEVHEEDPEADHVVVDHDQDPKVAELAVLQATAHAKSKFATPFPTKVRTNADKSSEINFYF